MYTIAGHENCGYKRPFEGTHHIYYKGVYICFMTNGIVDFDGGEQMQYDDFILIAAFIKQIILTN